MPNERFIGLTYNNVKWCTFQWKDVQYQEMEVSDTATASGTHTSIIPGKDSLLNHQSTWANNWHADTPKKGVTPSKVGGGVENNKYSAYRWQCQPLLNKPKIPKIMIVCASECGCWSSITNYSVFAGYKKIYWPSKPAECHTGGERIHQDMHWLLCSMCGLATVEICNFNPESMNLD